MAEIASAFVSLLPSAKGFGSKLESDVGSEVKGSAKRLGSGFGKAFAVAGGALAAVGIGKFLSGAIADATESAKITALTEQVIKTTGGAAKVTSNQVQDLAGSIAAKTGIDDAAIQSASNLLLTFTNLRNEVGKGNDIFNQATQIATDMGVALGNDPKSAAIGLGKALNDPIKGVTALSKVGVSFSDVQKEQIKGFVEAGDTAKAQKVILGELNREFGGAAEAQATAADKAAFAFGELKESIGTLLLPVVEKLATAATDHLLPALTKTVDGVGGVIAILTKGDFTGAAKTFGFAEDSGQVAFLFGLRDALKKVAAVVKPFAEAFGEQLVAKINLVRDAFGYLQPLFDKIGGFIRENPKTVKVFAGVLVGLVSAIGAVTLATTLFSIALNSTGIPLIIIGIAALAAGLYYAYTRSETFRNIVNDIGAALKDFGSFLKTQVLPVLISLGKTIASKAKPILKQLGQTFREDILPALAKLTEKFREIQPTLQDVAGFVFKLYGKFLEFSVAVLGKVIPILIQFVGYVVRRVVPIISTIIDVLVRFVGFIRTKVVPFVLKLASAFLNMAKFGIDAFRFLLDAALGTFEGILNAADKGLGWVPGLGDKIGNAKEAFSKFRDSTAGALDSLSEKVGKSADALDKLAKPRSTTFTTYFKSVGTKNKGSRDDDITGGAGSPRIISPRAIKGFGDGLANLRKVTVKELTKMVDAATKARDKIKDNFEKIGDLFDGVATSVRDAFRPDLFSGNLADLFSVGSQAKADLKAVIAAFSKLKNITGVSDAFLSQLFSSGNTGLILDLAGSDAATVRNASGLFTSTNSLSSQLGQSVAKNEYGAQLSDIKGELRRANAHLSALADQLAKKINAAAKKGHRDGKGGKK